MSKVGDTFTAENPKTLWNEWTVRKIIPILDVSIDACGFVTAEVKDQLNNG